MEQNLKEREGSRIHQYAELFVEVDQAIAKAGVTDAGAARIAGYPYLRITRLLSSYRNEVPAQSFESWVDQLQGLAIEGWQVELMNLQTSAKQRLAKIANTMYPAKPTLIEALQDCGKILRKHDLDGLARQAKLKEKAIAPSEYRLWQRIVGLYPITSLAFRLGIKYWHQQTLETYQIPLANLPVKGQLIRYTPTGNRPHLKPDEVIDMIKSSSNNTWGIPILDQAMQKSYSMILPQFLKLMWHPMMTK